MVAVVLHKYLNYAANKTTNTGHTTNINYTLKLSIILLYNNTNHDINY